MKDTELLISIVVVQDVILGTHAGGLDGGGVPSIPEAAVHGI